MRRVFFISLTIIIGMVLSSCSILHTPDPTADYKILEQTAAARITQTFEAMPTATATFTPVPTNTPEPTATTPPTPTEDTEAMLISRSEEDGDMLISRGTEVPTAVLEPTATIPFPDKAEFVAALPSPNQFLPNQRFNLTWQLKNTGTSTWSGKYRFYYSDGIQLADRDSFSIAENVEPGKVLTITMPATAPGSEGTYKTTWVLENPDGIPFYWVNFITIVGDKTFITQEPELAATVTPSSLEWMCSDVDRSRIQGDGCLEFCIGDTITQMEANGLFCYVDGERIRNAE